MSHGGIQDKKKTRSRTLTIGMMEKESHHVASTEHPVVQRLPFKVQYHGEFLNVEFEIG